MATATTQVLILADDKRLKEVLTEALARCGVRNVSASILKGAQRRIEEERPELILADLDSAGADTLDLIAGLRKSGFAGSIVVLAGNNSILRAREALAQGATGYLRKPVEGWEVERALKEWGARWSGRSREKVEEDGATPIYGSSPEIQAVLKIVDQVARREDDLTLIGEAGSGKRLIGRMIHRASGRNPARFISLGCSGLSESVIDPELFGQRDQQAARAGGRHGGCLEWCEGGTLLLDEVGNLPRRTQEKLLRRMTRRNFQAAGRGGAQLRRPHYRNVEPGFGRESGCRSLS